MRHVPRSVDDQTIFVGRSLAWVHQEYGASPCGAEQPLEQAGAEDDRASAEPAAAPCWRRLPATRHGQSPPILQYPLLRQCLVAGRPMIRLPKMAPRCSCPPGIPKEGVHLDLVEHFDVDLE